MKLFVSRCHNCSNKIQLDLISSSRSELRQKLGSEMFHVVCQSCTTKQTFSVSDVVAEVDSNSTLSGALIGGLIGLIGGPLGLLIGGGIGLGIGNSVEEDEKKKVDFFNQSR